MNAEHLEALRQKRGLLGTCVITGTVESWYAQCHEDARSYHDKNGFHAIEYRKEDARLVEAGRDKLAIHMMEQNYEWMVMIDADATFQQDAIIRLLYTAFYVVPDSDMVGAYIQLKGPNGICAIDTGTGTWEEHYPGEGVIPVIRTGGHFFLCKRSAFEKVGRPPYFRTREAPRALDAMAELDGYARQNHSGRNPFADTTEWQTLLAKATANGGGQKSGVGEDSSWCDLLKSRGGNIYVDSNIVTGHISKEIIGPERLKKFMDDRQRKLGLVCGMY